MRRSPRLLVRVAASPGRGQGLFATRPLDRGVVIDTWEALVCDGDAQLNRVACAAIAATPAAACMWSDESQNRTWVTSGPDGDVRYLFAVSTGGGPLPVWRRINHSAVDTNVRVRVVRPTAPRPPAGTQRRAVLVAVTTREVLEGDELFLDYGGHPDPGFLP